MYGGGGSNGGFGFGGSSGGNNPGIFNLSSSNKQNKKEFTERIKRAQDNAEKGKYAVKIQRRFRANRLRESIRRDNLRDVLLKLRDLKIVTGNEKLRAIFFLKIDVFSGILSLFGSGISARSLAKNSPSEEELVQMLDTLSVLFACAAHSTNKQASVHHPVYNYLTGHRYAIHTLPLWLGKLDMLCKKHSENLGILGKIRTICELLLKPQPIPAEGFLQVYARQWGLMVTRLLGQLIRVPGQSISEEPFWNLAEEGKEVLRANSILALELPTEAELKKCLEQASTSCIQLVGKGLQKLERVQQILLFADNTSVDLFSALLRLRKKLYEQTGPTTSNLDYKFITVIDRLLTVRQKEMPSAGTMLDKKLIGFAEFLLDLFTVNPTDEFLLRLFSGLKSSPTAISHLLQQSYASLKPLLSLSLSSTQILTPSPPQLAWAFWVLSCLKNALVVATREEFAVQGMHLDLLLQILFYLQNYCAHAMLGEHDSHTWIVGQLAGDIIKVLWEYQNVKLLFDPNRLQMCKLNKFFYELMTKSKGKLRPEEASSLHRVLCLFPHSYPFETRVALFPLFQPPAAAAAIFIRVKRQTLLQDALTLARTAYQEGNATAKVRVTFVDAHGMQEAGHDDGGLWKELVVQSLRTILSPAYGRFAEQNNLLYFNPQGCNPQDPRAFDDYFLAGWLLGRALRDGILVPTYLSPLLTRALLGRRNGLNQLFGEDPDLYHNLLRLKQTNGSESLLLTFTALDRNGKSIELVPGGSNREVNDTNKLEYIIRYVDHRLQGHVETGLGPFILGFSSVVPRDVLKMFNEEELSVLISGVRADINLFDWKSNTVYRAGYADKQSYIKDFWSVVDSFSEEEKRKLLKFVTCNDRPPILGFAVLNPRFTIQQPENSSDDRLPEASTCFNTLRLPRYSKKSILKERLLFAIQHNQGFYNI